MWLRITSLSIPYERGPLVVGATALRAVRSAGRLDAPLKIDLIHGYVR